MAEWVNLLTCLYNLDMIWSEFRVHLLGRSWFVGQFVGDYQQLGFGVIWWWDRSIRNTPLRCVCVKRANTAVLVTVSVFQHWNKGEYNVASRALINRKSPLDVTQLCQTVSDLLILSHRSPHLRFSITLFGVPMILCCRFSAFLKVRPIRYK